MSKEIAKKGAMLFLFLVLASVFLIAVTPRMISALNPTVERAKWQLATSHAEYRAECEEWIRKGDAALAKAEKGGTMRDYYLELADVYYMRSMLRCY